MPEVGDDGVRAIACLKDRMTEHAKIFKEPQRGTEERKQRDDVYVVTIGILAVWTAWKNWNSMKKQHLTHRGIKVERYREREKKKPLSLI